MFKRPTFHRAPSFRDSRLLCRWSHVTFALFRAIEFYLHDYALPGSRLQHSQRKLIFG